MVNVIPPNGNGDHGGDGADAQLELGRGQLFETTVHEDQKRERGAGHGRRHQDLPDNCYSINKPAADHGLVRWGLP